MRVGNFSVMIPEGVERDSGHVEMLHDTQYTIRIMNHQSRQCDAEVEVDGKSLGVFRLRANGQMRLECTPEDKGRFTFLADTEEEAFVAGITGIARADRGLIQVKFVPEMAPRYSDSILHSNVVRPEGFRDQSRYMSTPDSAGELRSFGGGSAQSFSHTQDSAKGLTGGITGLTGRSDQTFVDAGSIQRDEANAVTISLRLVCNQNQSGQRVRPLREKSAGGNPVPRPIN